MKNGGILLLLAFACVVLPNDAVAQQVEVGVFRIIAQHSGKCLDVHSASTADGANVMQWECHEPGSDKYNAHNQHWRVYYSKANRQYEIRALHSNKCLDVEGESHDAKANVFQCHCHGGRNQKWKIAQYSDGTHELSSVNTSGMCLDVYGRNRRNETNVMQYHCNNQTNQSWAFEPIKGPTVTNNALIRTLVIGAAALSIYTDMVVMWDNYKDGRKEERAARRRRIRKATALWKLQAEEKRNEGKGEEQVVFDIDID